MDGAQGGKKGRVAKGCVSFLAKSALFNGLCMINFVPKERKKDGFPFHFNYIYVTV